MFVSIGNSRMDKKFNCTDMTYEDFVSRLSKTKYTAETMEQYRKMPKGQQDNIKDVGGFVLGKLKGGRRKKDCVISRSAITLDMDYGTQGIIDELEMFFDMKMVVYSTHKHTPEKPRLRIIIFLSLIHILGYISQSNTIRLVHFPLTDHSSRRRWLHDI